MKLTVINSQDWSLARGPAAAPARRGAPAAAAAGSLPSEFLLPGVTIVDEQQAIPVVARRAAAAPAIELSVDCAAGESAIVVARHDSGAITFHGPIQQQPIAARRGRASAGRKLQFHVAPRQSTAAARRGLFGSAVKLILLKVKDAAVDAAVGAAVRLGGTALEQLWWNNSGLVEGWFQVAPTANSLRLSPIQPSAFTGERSLLLLHGTFSNAAAAFSGLATTAGDFFTKARAVYGNRIYAYNHFSVSRTPQENAEMLLDGLPEKGQTFDVITHSRGGLVLRTLIEQRDVLGANASRFDVGQAVLVAAPNLGTPLATPGRWQETIGLVANLLEMFPDNPWTTGAQFVAHGITWLASKLLGNLPGLTAMDGAGPTIAALQEPSRVRPDMYAVLAANYNPTGAIWQRLLDIGIDAFFAGANDLVVPAEGSWSIDGPPNFAVLPRRIACFGSGGNLRTDGTSTVNHLNFFEQPETIQYLLQTLVGPQPTLPPIDPGRPLPTGKLFRGASVPAMVTDAPEVSLHPPPPPPSMPATAGAGGETVPSGTAPAAARRLYGIGTVLDNTLQITILDGQEDSPKTILAIYGSARVVDDFVTQNDKNNPPPGRRQPAADKVLQPGTRYQRIIGIHKRIRSRLEGVPDSRPLPEDEELREFGTNLFEALFPEKVRRLYDVARSQQDGEPLNVVFTSTSPWLAALPWEFAFDPSRRKFLVTEDVHFTRNVLTSVPPQRLSRQRAALEMLIVVAQPLGTVPLSVEEEEARIRHSFEPRTRDGLVNIDVLSDATPASLHGKIQAREMEMLPNGSDLPGEDRRYDVVHFIGHGEFDKQASEGKLLFQTRSGGLQTVNLRTLRELLCGRGIQLVFLNACDTAEDNKSTLNRGIAQALVEAGIPAVIANQYPVLDGSAVGFADHFYWSLAHGASLGKASREARIALNYSIGHESIDWAVPVLFARDPTYRLCARSTVGAALPPWAERTSAFAAPQTAPKQATGFAAGAPPAPRTSKVLRVGVADLPRFFPGLNDVLFRFNEVQDRFMFESVDVVAPLGVWDVRSDSGESHSYLLAEQFAELLRSKPRELGVDFLACVTNRRMRDKDTYNIYGWWSSQVDLPILLFSTAGFQLTSFGDVAGRTIANELVAGLAAQMLESTTNLACIHVRGPKVCPFYYDEDRDMEVITGPRKFDNICRKKLVTKLPKDFDPQATVDALDKLLTAYADPSGRA